VLLLRVQLPDRPGSLGVVATAMGTVGADISAIEIIEKADGEAINDFMVTMPPHAMPDSLVSVCNELDGVRVLWVSRYPENWGIESDLDAVDQMSVDPARALEVLVSSAPKVFHCQWALALDGQGAALARTELAPDITPETLSALSPWGSLRASELDEGWSPGWGETTIAVCPLSGGGAVVLGRQGGPQFLASELRRLQYLSSMAAT